MRSTSVTVCGKNRTSPAVLPLRNIRNKGEVDQYYAEGTQEAIIDKEIFQKVRQIFNKKAERISERSEPQKRPYTKVLYCGDCGWAYKPKHPKDARRWVCSGSGIAGQSCCSTSVTETEIERTFVSLYNRLKQHEDLIIQKTLKQLVGLKKHITVESDSISEIDREIASLSDENSMYIRFFQQGMMDEITFREQTGAVNNRINELRSRRQKLLHEDEDEVCIEILRKLKEQLTDMPDALLWFEPEIFSTLISKIHVISKDTLAFELKCGLKLKEAIAWD